MKACILLIAARLVLAQDGAVIEGTAYNKVTQAGVPGVSITLATPSAPDTHLYTATSDTAGFFRIESVKYGDYVASFKAPDGFLAPRRSDPSCKPFQVVSGGEPTKLRIPIAPMGSVGGRVLDAAGNPVPRVRVEIYRVHGGGGATVITNSEGRFSQSGLVPGPYRLRARPVLEGTPLSRRLKTVSPLSAKPPEGERWIWAPTYFPDSTEINGATTIIVREGLELPGFDIHICSAPVFRLRGMVLDDEGKPAASVGLRLESETGWSAAEAETTSGQDGAFEFPSVRSGNWQITAQAARGETTLKGFAEFIMPRRNVEDVELRIARPFTLDGVIEGTPQPLTAKTSLIVGLFPTTHGEQSVTTEQPGGKLHFENLYPGIYRIGPFSKLPGHYLKSILLGTQDVSGLDVTLLQNSPPIRMIYAPNAAHVRGRVENGAGVKVVLIEADQQHFITGESMRVSVCDREGQFAVDGLRPTTYYALALETSGNMNSGDLTEAVFAGGLGQSVQTVRLAEGDIATLNLAIAPWPF